jgi:UPF0716 family protein affecting phage T7 exclusion
LSIAALGIAVTYLLIIVAGAIGALLVMLWLFEDTLDATRTGRETVKDLRNPDGVGMESTPSALVEPERSEDKAA